MIFYFLFAFIMSDILFLADNSTDDQWFATLWIACDENQIKYGQCKFNINKPLQIKEENPDQTPGLFVQDAVLATTFFIGTVVTIWLIVSALKLIYGSIKGDDISTYKDHVINSLIGLILVLGAYVIVRIIQYLVRT